VSLFRSSLRPPAPLSDEAVEHYVAAIRASIQPDPLFRRRLRGHVLNRHVAAREGIGHRRVAREMSRIGRAVLYASFALSLSVTGAMAASQQAIPGDVFYPVKLQIEELRLRALPEDLHDELAGYVLAERVAELDRLAEAGDWSAVERHAASVQAAYDEVLAQGVATSEQVTDGLAVAGALLERLPEQARAVVEGVLAELPGVGPEDQAGTPDARRDHGGESDRGSGSGGPSEPGGADRPEPTPKPEPTKPPQAQPTRRPRTQPTSPPRASEPTKPPQAQPSTTPKPGNKGPASTRRP
jgi:hypothetical protein